VTGEWTRLHNEELRDAYFRVIRSGRMRWAGHVARMGEKSCVQGLDGRALRKETT
jgi:hypothetical protein